MKTRYSSKIALTLAVGALLISSSSAIAQDSSRSVRYKNSKESTSPTQTRSSSTTRMRSSKSEASRSRYPSRSTSNRYKRRIDDNSVSGDRRGENVSRSRYDRNKNTGAAPSSTSDSDWSLSKHQYNVLKDKIRDLKMDNERFKRKIEANGKLIKELSQNLSPALQRITVLEGKVQALEIQSPGGQATAQINAINKQISDIKKVINTIPGVSI